MLQVRINATSRIAALVLTVSVMVVGLVAPGVAFEVDATDLVTSVVDGDTFDTFANGRIRLADVDTPERKQPGFEEAKEALEDMIGGREVFLDIDDVSRTDPSGERLVCVVYIQHNSTHVLNVNKALVESGWAVVDDFTNNEFNPSTWTTYSYYPGTAGSPTLPWAGSIYVLAVIVVIIVVFFSLLYMGLRRKR